MARPGPLLGRHAPDGPHPARARPFGVALPGRALCFRGPSRRGRQPGRCRPNGPPPASPSRALSASGRALPCTSATFWASSRARRPCRRRVVERAVRRRPVEPYVSASYRASGSRPRKGPLAHAPAELPSAAGRFRGESRCSGSVRLEQHRVAAAWFLGPRARCAVGLAAAPRRRPRPIGT